jgi:hypothetical protein
VYLLDGSVISDVMSCHDVEKYVWQQDRLLRSSMLELHAMLW